MEPSLTEAKPWGEDFPGGAIGALGAQWFAGENGASISEPKFL